jgi:hypothetical protein
MGKFDPPHYKKIIINTNDWRERRRGRYKGVR